VGALLPIHIAAGGLAIILGGIALFVAKGSRLHRRAGLFFVYAMLVMGTSGSILALHKSWTDANVMGGFMTVYFVVTALTTVRPVSAATRWINAAALVVAIGLALVDVSLGIVAFKSPRGAFSGVPFFMLFFLASIFTLSAVGDVRQMQQGPLRGSPRLKRHLWRMCFALFIAAGSFFSIRARVAAILPAFFATPLMRTLPILTVFGAMFYWMWKLRGGRTIPRTPTSKI
jgi:uncharacterized membrane protein